MGAKVVWYRGAWWVRTHHDGKKRDRRIGPAKKDQRTAERLALKINAKIELGEYRVPAREAGALAFDAYVKKWHRSYSPTFKPSYETTSKGLLDNHLVPFFGSKDLREITEEDLLRYIRAKLDKGLSPATILNGLSIVRRVFNLAQREGLVTRNPASRLGELMRRVGRRTATETAHVDSWTEEEVQTLLALASAHEPRFAPALLCLFSTGLRRGELLGLKWEDVDFERGRLAIRRAIVADAVTTPKSGRGRMISMPLGLASALLDLLAERRRESIREGWPDVPEWVFCSETGGPLGVRNFERSWLRLRRRAQKKGVRPLRLHCTRHTYASRALAAGKSVRWVAEQLGHSNPELTLRTYAHVLPEEESDLSFAEFDFAKRLSASPAGDTPTTNEKAAEPNPRRPSRNLERVTGVEPATLSLGS